MAEPVYVADPAPIRPLFRGTQLVWGLVALIDLLLIFRFFLKLFAANFEAGFSQFIYVITAPLAAPFLYVFNISVVDNSVIEWGTILAIFVYTLAGAGIVKLLVMSKPITTPEAESKLDEN